MIDGQSPEYTGNAYQLVSAVDYALARNVVLVAGDGDPKGRYMYPAGLPGVIGVASEVLPGGPTGSSLFGTSTSGSQSEHNNSALIAGPGNGVIASRSGWGMFGAGVAAAYVTATVALIKERYPDMSPTLVSQALAMSARHHPSGGYATSVGFGLLDPYDAVLDAGKLAKNTATASAVGGAAVDAGSHFGAGPPPGAVYALPPDTTEVIASSAWIAAGAVLLALAVVLAVRRRKRRALPSAV
jgi:hypothetical protein